MLFSKTKTVQGLFYLNALIWLILGWYTLLNRMGRYPGGALTVYGISFMMIGNGGAMFLSGIWIGAQKKWTYFFAVFVLVVHIVLTVTDQFGFFDLVALIVDLAILGLLISMRRHYLSNETNS